MRSLHKSWQDRRPEWRRRVRWYEGRIGDALSIRLKFTDFAEGRECNRFYTDRDRATSDYEAFIASETTVKQLASQS